ncbi:hypothetical protein FQZ97_1255300 [compost metagenome]
MLEEHDAVVALLPQVPADRGADPVFGPIDHLPQHPLGGLEFQDLHVDGAELGAIGGEAKGDHAAHLALPLRVGRPPAGQAFARAQRFVDLIRGRLDADSVQDIHHDCSLRVD